MPWREIGDYLRYVDINASALDSMPALSRRRPAAVSRLPDITSIVVGLRRIVRALEVYSHDVRRTYGLTAPQLWALKTLAKTGPLTTGQLAQILLIHPSSASLLVDRLERRGLVNRVRLQNDRRFVRIRADRACGEPLRGSSGAHPGTARFMASAACPANGFGPFDGR